MKTDLVLAAVVLVFGIFGLLSGAIPQLVDWAGLALGTLAAKPLARRLTPLVAARLHRSPAVVRVVLAMFGFYLLYALGAHAVHWALRKLTGEREGHPADKAGGFLLGLGKGAAGVFVLVSMLLLLQKPFEQRFGKAPEDLSRSRALALVRRHNFFGQAPPELAQLEKAFGGVEGGPLDLSQLRKNPRIEALLRQIQPPLPDPGSEK